MTCPYPPLVPLCASMPSWRLPHPIMWLPVHLPTSRTPAPRASVQIPWLSPTSGCPSQLPSPMGNLEMTWQQYRKFESFREILPWLMNASFNLRLAFGCCSKTRIIRNCHHWTFEKHAPHDPILILHKSMSYIQESERYMSLELTVLRICISSSWVAPRWRCHEVGTSTWLVVRGSSNFLQKTNTSYMNKYNWNLSEVSECLCYTCLFIHSI